ncbi:MAG TPA: DUF92 domain-containing protein [Gemmatimonadaceae bacterium]
MSVLARRARALSSSGSLAAGVIGTIALTAGWSWGALLLSLFISVSLLSRLGAGEKAKRINDLIEKGGERDAAQIIANGAVFTIAALGSLIAPATGWFAIAAGAVSFSAADTWATEIGTLARHDPILIINGRRVPAGTSGGISVLGTLAALSGAVFIGVEAVFAAWPVSLAGIGIGGVGAAFADSVIGATLQTRRWCDRCNNPTERRVHDCGTPTRITGGIRWLDNDAVNALCSAIGALIALVLQ